MGHGEHGLGPKMKIPNYTIYKVENHPELIELRDILASKGLKDPWLRNEAWRYDLKEWGTKRHIFKNFLFRGFSWGFAAFVATIAIETALSVSKKDTKSDH